MIIRTAGCEIYLSALTDLHQSFALNRAGQGVWVTIGEFHKRGDVFVFFFVRRATVAIVRPCLVAKAFTRGWAMKDSIESKIVMESF